MQHASCANISVEFEFSILKSPHATTTSILKGSYCRQFSNLPVVKLSTHAKQNTEIELQPMILFEADKLGAMSQIFSMRIFVAIVANSNGSN